MKVSQLSAQESALSGFTHVVNLKVTASGVGDIAVQGVTSNVISVPVGSWIKDVAIDVKTPWNNLSGTAAISVGVASSGVASSTLLSGVSLAAAGYSASSSGVVVNSASQFLTITQIGTGTSSSTGEANITFRIADLSRARVTFAQ